MDNITFQPMSGKPWMCSVHTHEQGADGEFPKEDKIAAWALVFHDNILRCPFCGGLALVKDKVMSTKNTDFFRCIDKKCNRASSIIKLADIATVVFSMADIRTLPEFRGKGYATQVINKLKEHCNRLLTQWDASSEEGRKVCLKNGMVKEGNLLVWEKSNENEVKLESRKKIEPTKEMREVLVKCIEWYEFSGNECGGELHVELDDDNTDDFFIDTAIRKANRSKYDNYELALEILEGLRLFPENNRTWVTFNIHNVLNGEAIRDIYEDKE